jgi:hypothetical protein
VLYPLSYGNFTVNATIGLCYWKNGSKRSYMRCVLDGLRLTYFGMTDSGA